MNSSLGPLQENGRVLIIGGGPGGAACAIALQRTAAQMNKSIQITVLEGKQFSGERHHNQCVGVLSPPLPSLLEEKLDMSFPYHLGREEIQAYILHAARDQIKLTENGIKSIALRRVQFDNFFMETVQERGISVIAARAVALEFHVDRVVVYTESGTVECDVVVGAFGMDEGSAALFARQTNYRSPRALSSIVTKYHPSPKSMEEFGSNIHAFLPNHPKIEFGAITPKGNHLTINIAGRTVDVSLMEEFLNDQEVRSLLPDMGIAEQLEEGDFRFFKGRFPTSLAKKFYGDRYVIIGDAAGLVRAFKGKGVTSAVLTGIRAAETMLKAGISKDAFHHHYRRANRDIIDDLPFGQGMRHLTILSSRFGLLDIVIRAADRNPFIRAALFDAISAHAPYRQVLARILRPRSVAAIMRSVFA